MITRPLSVSYAMIFAVIGVVILIGIERASFAPMIFPLAGGFMLVGPVLLSGFFAMADRVRRDELCRFSDIVHGFSRTSREMLTIALVCTLLFMIWVADVATVYGFTVGRVPASLLTLFFPSKNVLSFMIWSSVLGALLAFVIFSISAFSVPLLYYRRAGLVQAIVSSVTAVFRQSATEPVVGRHSCRNDHRQHPDLPTFLLTFPVLAFASHALYRELFPELSV
ncbi:MAG: DUF2189 domain-containing protein [Propionivibrio sp.]|uniref:DUF2189 domain-containing protein n=1 Tax=Propionivibrio sp. TaxID=2212460 RepID=UPI0025D99804|nr:DUF2189 domain-containing protein [Propionivibrio sp.]MBK8895048.1 DUF2189 domain-containing protein [Propionivibrio sp.]